MFTGTFTTGGLDVAFEDGRLRIVREGKVRKFVPRAEHITYPVRANVASRGQRALIVTERAVFEVTPEGLLLTEVAPGIDVRTQVLGQMDIGGVRVAPDVATMAPDLFAA